MVVHVADCTCNVYTATYVITVDVHSDPTDDRKTYKVSLPVWLVKSNEDIEMYVTKVIKEVYTWHNSPKNEIWPLLDPKGLTWRFDLP